MRVLFLDCFSGISGDMTVGALCDLGIKPSAFEWELSKIEIGDFHAHWERKTRQNIDAVKFSIHEGATHTHDQDEHEAEGHHHDHSKHDHDHGHHHHEDEEEAEDDEHEHEGHSHEGHKHEHHDHEEHGHEHKHEGHEHDHENGEHAHHHHDEEHHHEHGEHCHHDHGHSRSWSDIRKLIETSDLSEFVKKHSLGIFQRIAVAEAKIHGMKVEEVTFHEVGALDSIADIVLACVGIETLKIDRVIASPLAEGRGWIDAAHGRFPVPAPATLEILKGIPLASIDEAFEFITPTGAAIVAEFAAEFGPMPAMKIEKIGYGAGSRSLKGRPNVLRAVLGEAVETAGSEGLERDTILRMETNIDDLSPEMVGAVTEQLLKEGALDTFLTPIQMKKNRPALLLTVLCEEGLATKLAEVIFRQTTSFGVRMDRVERLKLERKFETVETAYGKISVKLGILRGETLQVSPEFESCKAASEKTGTAIRVIYDAAVQAWGKK
jgi:pyridinium-3,5-bisthiocarboxylic acid mononucleotide nickel chelatase